LRFSSERLFISQRSPAPSATLKRIRSLGQRSASKKACAPAASGSFSANVNSVEQSDGTHPGKP
jgi:hypothetical protein